MKIAIVGVGNMGGAVLAGLAKAGHEVRAGVRRPERGEELAEQYGVTHGSAPDVVDGADVVILGVKPYDILRIIGELPLSRGQLLISLAAGITTEQMEGAAPDGVGVVRVMPNTPAVLGQGMSIISAGTSATPEQVTMAEQVMAAVGATVTIPEKQLDAATALSGSGPAYVFHIAEALIEAGVHLGLTRAVATQLVEQTLVGSSLLLQQSDEHPAVLREQVTSPGGTTAAALAVLEADGLRSTFLKATRANRDRSREIAREG
ncbi:pyrroline-5-carboxylate reductase [Nocardioides sp. Kera G14]|uniref:pyrroline-5-carboxylate reductase n=1 Tax=Nocardioides sp. Kera G14 TaxID=2884264 RepID=UPI001D10E3EF|nr:pyrroline-5-carboxylate reductase [Nocardioides sp. Kera G14]UDY23870.1 pyrroline-5-carboxylate reductase [Nocardioides sp. Kera G14]